MNFGRGLREGHNYFMGVHNTIASSEAIAFFCRIFSFPGRNVLYIPSYEQTRLAIDKNICEEISRLLCQLKKKKRGGKKRRRKKRFLDRILRFDRESISAYFPLRTGKETNIHVRCSWDSFLYCPLASPLVLSKKQRN